MGRIVAIGMAPLAEHRTISAIQVELGRLAAQGIALDADLRTASADTKAAPSDAIKAAMHLECADRLSANARQKERLEEVLLALISANRS